MTLVTATEWNVSYQTFSALFSRRAPNLDEEGVTLHVYRTDDTVPNEWGGMGVTIHHPDNGRKFDTIEDAEAYALAAGLLKEYKRHV